MEIPTIKLRFAKPEDEAFLFRLYVALRQTELENFGWSEQQKRIFLEMQFRAQQAQYHSYPETSHEIVLYDHEPVGQILISQMGDQIRLVDMALLPPFRNLGIGTYLLNKLLLSATQKNQPISLHVTIDNPARGLYERLGFYVKEESLPYLLMEWKPIPHKETHRMLDTLHVEDFVAHIESSFALTLPDGTTHQLKLTEAKDLSVVNYQEQFSLHFHAPLTMVPAQGIYHLAHETLGEGDIFLVPVARDANVFTFEAIFNRPRVTEPSREQ